MRSRRGNGARVITDRRTAAGGATILAYLKDTASRVLCFYAPCSHRSTVALCDYDDTEVASYCTGHGRQALKEYGRALEERLAEAEEVA